MKNSFHSDNFICLINATSQALTLSNDLTQSPSALQSRLIRKVHHIGCIRLIFCVFSIGNASPTITEFTKNWLKGWTLSTPFPFQLVALIFSFGGVTAESDKAENGQRWGRGILKKRWPVCEEDYIAEPEAHAGHLKKVFPCLISVLFRTLYHWHTVR